MSKREKPSKFENLMRLLDNNGGPVLAFLALLAFLAYLTYAHFYPTNAVVKTLERHGSAAQVVSVAFILLVALVAWGYRKVLFKIAEREQLRERVIRSEAHTAEWKERATQAEARKAELENSKAELENSKAELENSNAELRARIAELESERRQPPDEEERD